MMRPEIRTGWVAGLLGELVRWHGLYYVRGLGWPAVFEAIVACEAGELAAVSCAPAGEDAAVGVWSAWLGDEFLAGLAVDARRAAIDGARLRFFIASDAARGHGLGDQLMRAATAYCDARGISRMWLTTVRGLEPAAHLYRKHGFNLVDEHVDTTWGTPKDEQRYERVVRTPAPRKLTSDAT